jgi:hypothetical protein
MIDHVSLDLLFPSLTTDYKQGLRLNNGLCEGSIAFIVELPEPYE